MGADRAGTGRRIRALVVDDEPPLATQPGGAVTVATQAHHGEVHIAVTDTGEGIAAAHLPHVFDRFYRADPARSRATGGSGIGLTIVRALARSHGGDVRAASDGVGRGATFTLILPALGP